MAFVSQERMGFGDTDASGLAYFAALLRFFEIGEREVLRQVGALNPPYRRASEHDSSDFAGLIFPRVHVSCDYKSPARADDLLTIVTLVSRLGRSSITWEVVLRRDTEIVAEGTMITVCVDQSSGQSVALPLSLRDALEQISGGGTP